MIYESEAIVIKAKKSGEDSTLLTVFSEKFGTMKGLVKGGSKKRSQLQAGNILKVSSKKRLANQLGTLTVEVVHQPSATCFHNMLHLQTIHYICEMLDTALKDEDPHPNFYKTIKNFLQTIEQPNLWRRVAGLEHELLRVLGYRLSLEGNNAVRLENEDSSPLLYVSPKSGRAVSKLAGEPYKNKLFRLPMLFGGEKCGKNEDFLDVFKLTGHFLRLAVHTELPARDMLISMGVDEKFVN